MKIFPKIFISTRRMHNRGAVWFNYDGRSCFFNEQTIICKIYWVQGKQWSVASNLQLLLYQIWSLLQWLECFLFFTFEFACSIDSLLGVCTNLLNIILVGLNFKKFWMLYFQSHIWSVLIQNFSLNQVLCILYLHEPTQNASFFDFSAWKTTKTID